MVKTDKESGVDRGGSIWTITRGASLFILGNIVSKVLLFVLNLILTRTLGATLYGIYAYANTIIGVVFIIVRMGAGESLHRFIPKYSNDPQRQKWIVALAYGTGLISSTVIAAGLFILAPAISKLTLDDPLLRDVMRILAVALPFMSVIYITNSVFRSLEKLEYQVAISNILKPVIKLLTVLAAVALGFSLLGIVAALLAGTVVLSIIAILFLYTMTDVHPTGTLSSGDYKEFYNFSIPMMLKDVGSNLYNRVDILMVGFFLTGSAVGIYRVSWIIASALLFPLAGINQLFPPIASKLYTNGNISELESVYSIVTRWIFTLVLFPSLVVLIYRNEILGMFGSQFPEGSLVLVFFTIAQLANSISGPCGKLLAMTDNQYLNVLNQWILGVSNIVLNYILIINFGIIGAGLATATVLASVNIIRMIEVWYIEDLFPYSWKFAKPLAAGLSSILVMLGLRVLLSGFQLMFVGAVIGGLTYLSMLYLFGFEDTDAKFYRNNIKGEYL